MVSWARRRKSKQTRKISEKRYEKHHRHNILKAEPGVTLHENAMNLPF
jgi:hypothetical protein